MPPGAWEPAALPIWSMFRPCSFDSSSHPGAPPLEDFALAVASNLMLSGPQARRLSPSARASPCRSFVPPAPSVTTLLITDALTTCGLLSTCQFTCLHALTLPQAAFYRPLVASGLGSGLAAGSRAPLEKTSLLFSRPMPHLLTMPPRPALRCLALSKTSSQPPAPAPAHLPRPLPFLSRRLRLRLVEARELLRRRPQERSRA